VVFWVITPCRDVAGYQHCKVKLPSIFRVALEDGVNRYLQYICNHIFMFSLLHCINSVHNFKMINIILFILNNFYDIYIYICAYI
jgi:hypothetical protein